MNQIQEARSIPSLLINDYQNIIAVEQLDQIGADQKALQRLLQTYETVRHTLMCLNKLTRFTQPRRLEGDLIHNIYLLSPIFSSHHLIN